jgi:hypothetical protein
MANPFTVQPLGGFQGVQNITQGMQSIARRSEMNDQEEQAQRQAEQKSALNTEAQRLLSSGTTQEIAAFSIANPDYGKAIREQIQFASDETDANMMSGMQQIISGADPEQVLNDRATFVEAQGGDATQTRQEIQRFREDPEGYVKQMGGLYAFMDPKGSEAFGKATAGPGSPKFGNVQPGDFTPASLQQFSQTGNYTDLQRYESAKSVNIGGVPHVFDPAFGGYRPASVSSGGVPANATAQSVGDSEAQITAANERAKLNTQREIQPSIEAAVDTAKTNVKTLFAQADIQKNNARTLEVYDVAMGNLAESLGSTITGPGVSWIPALTADAQIAEGAQALMAPVLKSMFRTAGEGTFTDKDQELLLRMVPTRSDLAESRVSKIEAIDLLVRSKLGAAPAKQRIKLDADGNIIQ